MFVRVECNTFNPATTTLTKGQTIQWDWICGTHTVTIHKVGDADGTNLYDSGGRATGNVTYNFASSGTFQVYCRFHGSPTSGMTSTVTAA